MTAEQEYWTPIIELRRRLGSWCRLAIDDGESYLTDWSMLLTIPVPGYLESGPGPFPFRHVRWVDFAPVILNGGRRGLPLTIRSTFDEFVSGLAETRAIWAVQEMTWTVERILTNQALRAIRVMNPFAARRS